MKGEIQNTLKRLGWVVFFFMIAILVVSAIEKKKSSHARDISIEIAPLQDGNSLISKGDIMLSLKRSFGYELTGIPLGAVDVERVERVLEEEPFILDAEVFVDASNLINIGVVQREPILRVIDNNGLDYYLDDKGIKLPLSRHFTARVIVATGDIPPHSPDFRERKKHPLKDVFDLTNLILKDEFFKSLIEQIHLGSKGEFTLIPKVGRQKVLFGTFDNHEDKLWRLKKFYQQIMPYEGWRKYKSIDLRYKQQVVTKKR